MIRKVVNKYGDIIFYNELDQIHQDIDEPAIIYREGGALYCKHNQAHCLSGPAWIPSDGTVEYYIYGKGYTKEEFDMHPLVREYRLKKTIEDLLK